MSTRTPANKETKRCLTKDFAFDHAASDGFKLGPHADQDTTFVRIKRSNSIMNSPALEDEDDLILPLQNCSIKGTKKPDEFEETSPISNDNGTPLLSTPPSSVVPDSVSRKVQASPLALTTPARKVARDRFIAGLQAGSLHGYDRNYKQGPYAPSDSESPVPSLPPTPTKSNSHKDSLAVSADHITTRITFDADGVTRDDLHSKPAEQIPDKHRATIETMRREWAVAAQLEELQQQIVRRRALRRPKIVAFPGGNVKGGSAEEEARFLKEKVTKATDEEKKAGDWQVKLLRTRHDDDERWTGKLRHMDELLTAHSSKLDAQYFAPLNPTLLPQSNRKWLDQQLLAGYGLRPAFDEPMKRLGDEEADSANLAPWMMPGEQGHAK
ncbi:hypothetical protein BC567DRAFT_295314 [Phyllosticta citribraziliensis]